VKPCPSNRAISLVGALAKKRPFLIGYMNEPPSSGLQYAHVNYPALYVFDPTFSYLETLGWSNIYGQVDSLAGRLAGGLSALGLSAVAPDAARAGIVSFSVPDADKLVSKLQEKKIYVQERSGLVRISPHSYNSETEIDRFVQGLKEASASLNFL